MRAPVLVLVPVLVSVIVDHVLPVVLVTNDFADLPLIMAISMVLIILEISELLFVSRVSQAKLCKETNAIVQRMPRIVITTISSTSVKP